MFSNWFVRLALVNGMDTRLRGYDKVEVCESRRVRDSRLKHVGRSFLFKVFGVWYSCFVYALIGKYREYWCFGGKSVDWGKEFDYLGMF